MRLYHSPLCAIICVTLVVLCHLEADHIDAQALVSFKEWLDWLGWFPLECLSLKGDLRKVYFIMRQRFVDSQNIFLSVEMSKT